ncbi:MAG: ABC-2 transporter permease [Lachnospiraceae bacterium]|nr:ABC-2 transporter permease [Lachnospiraceae bacterium]
MLGLLYKDLKIMKYEIIMMLLEMVVISVCLFLPLDTWLGEGSAVAGMAPVVVAFAVCIVVSMVQSKIFSLDERRVWAYYMTSTPFAAKGQVLSKYYLSIGLSAVAMIWLLLCDSLVPLFTDQPGGGSLIYIAFFFGQTFGRAIEIPFIIRFGEKNGGSYKILFGLGIFFLFIVYLLFGPLPDFSNPDFLEKLISIFSDAQLMSTGLLGFMAIAPYVIMIMYYISYKISCKLYLKGVDTYET